MDSLVIPAFFLVTNTKGRKNYTMHFIFAQNMSPPTWSGCPSIWSMLPNSPESSQILKAATPNAG
jgi:hypothetical protein